MMVGSAEGIIMATIITDHIANNEPKRASGEEAMPGMGIPDMDMPDVASMEAISEAWPTR
jgi:hypothetical protein